MIVLFRTFKQLTKVLSFVVCVNKLLQTCCSSTMGNGIISLASEFFSFQRQQDLILKDSMYTVETDMHRLKNKCHQCYFQLDSSMIISRVQNVIKSNQAKPCLKHWEKQNNLIRNISGFISTQNSNRTQIWVQKKRSPFLAKNGEVLTPGRYSLEKNT